LLEVSRAIEELGRRTSPGRQRSPTAKPVSRRLRMSLGRRSPNSRKRLGAICDTACSRA
jgi:hypothetical protein